MSTKSQVSRTKSITTVIVSLLIMLSLFGIFVIVFNTNKAQKQGSVTFIVDEVNSCSWQSGVVTSSTQAFGPLKTETVESADEEAFLESAEKEGRCVARLGDRSGSYGARLNEQYEKQQD